MARAATRFASVQEMERSAPGMSLRSGWSGGGVQAPLMTDARCWTSLLGVAELADGDLGVRQLLFGQGNELA